MTGYTFNQLFDFTRTTSGTFVGSNGLIQTTPASVNLLLYTQEFDNAAWIKFNSSATANTTSAPDGTGTADTITENTATGQHGVYQSLTVVSGTTYSLSGYVKANGRNIVQFLWQATTNVYFVEFNLADGTTTNRFGTGTATITAAGNGWYRITATSTATGSGTGYWQLNLCNVAGTISYTGDGTSGVYLWGAQLEAASAATTYTRNNGGVFPPRFDYDPVTLAPKGILIEEQRTNLLTYSEQFTDASWAVNGSPVITANAAVAPDGTSTADTMAVSGSSNGFGVYRNVVSSGTYASSVYFKLISGAFSLRVGLTSNFSVINCSTLAITNTGTGVGSVSAVGNGWYRFVSVGTISALSASEFYNIGSNTGTLAIWGAQLEAGAFATSYIPTVASQVTRSADVCNINAPMFAPWFNQNEGTFVVDSDVLFATITSKAAITTNDGTSNNINIVYIASSATVSCEVRSGGALTSALYPGTAIANVPIKTATAYAANNFAAASNGAAVSTDLSGAVALNQSELNVGYSRNYGGLQINGHIRSIKFFPFRASNNQLQALTL